MIEHFRATHPEVRTEVIHTYFESFSTGEQFDVIVMGFVLEHVEGPVEMLLHYRRFMKPGGKLFVAVPNAAALNRRLGHAAGMLPSLTAISEYDQLLGHKRYYTVATLREDLERGGYQIRRMEGLFLKPFTTRQMVELELDPRILTAMCEVGVDYPELCLGILAEVAIE